MKTVIKLIVCLLFVAGWQTLAAQDIQPSEVVSTQKAGAYQKVNYKQQDAVYNDIEYWESYLVNGYYFLLRAQSVVVLSADKKELYAWHNFGVDGWAAHPTFFFPKKKDRPFIVSVTSGMENYWGSTIYVVDKDKVTCAGHLDLAPMTGDYYAGEYDDIETVLVPVDKGKKGIRLTFACDTLIYDTNGDLFSGKVSTNDLYFTYLNDTLVPSSKYRQLTGVQRGNVLRANEEAQVWTPQFSDVNADGHEDMLYSKFDLNTCTSELVIYLCKDYKVVETLRLEIGFPVMLDYQAFTDGKVHAWEYTCKGGFNKKRQCLFRIENGKLLEEEIVEE